LQFIFHPVLQLSLEHLVFNTVLGLAAFTLLEKWTVLMSKNQRRIAFIMCYLASLVAVFIKWKYYGPDLRLVLGLSGMISAAAALLLTYYAFFRKQIRYKGPSVLAPFAIGILFWWVIDPLFEWVFVTRTWLPTELGNTSLFHFLAFLIALVLGSLLMLLARRRTSRQDHSLASM
jgi:CDP-diglyceride synthetase